MIEYQNKIKNNIYILFCGLYVLISLYIFLYNHSYFTEICIVFEIFIISCFIRDYDIENISNINITNVYNIISFLFWICFLEYSIYDITMNIVMVIYSFFNYIINYYVCISMTYIIFIISSYCISFLIRITINNVIKYI
jgi:hypothetical protein